MTGILTCALAVSGCAAAYENNASDSRIGLTVDWQRCGAPKPSPYYSVDFLLDGTVRYRGLGGVREKSNRTTRINAARVARLVESAMKIMSDRPERSAPPPPE